MANNLLTTQMITKEALKILEQEMEMREPNQVFSLVEIICKDGKTLGPIMLEMTPAQVHIMGRQMTDHPVLTLANDNEAILVMAHQVKHIKVMRVTSKE